MKVPIKRCALYTRKSSEEGLDQSFNSLDAQREACAAYVKSQAHEGWREIATGYDDGGYSGGSMERPALQRLLADIAAGRVDVIIVYKIDRLTRSLPDFARMVELFDRHAVSFVSVTQAFNTTSSMGRLTLNVLLSFAQFEREVTGERIRDKIAASKAKGMWMGGVLPLGYDPPTDSARALVVNPGEAEIVRMIFQTYLELGSVHALQALLYARGIRSKQRVTRNGKTLGGQPFSRGALFHLLRNRTYQGLIVHKDRIYPGLHPAIVADDLFEAVQARLSGNARRHGGRTDHVARAPLMGRIFDSNHQPMSPTFSHGTRGQVYRYYVSAPLQRGQKRKTDHDDDDDDDDDDDAIRRVSAPTLEAMLIDVLAPLGADPLAFLIRVEIYRGSVQVLLPAKLLPIVREKLRTDHSIEQDVTDPDLLRLTIPITMRLRGGRTWILGARPRIRRDPVLIKALRAAHAMLARGTNGMPVLDAAPAIPYHRRLVRLAFLAPALQRAILDGHQPQGLTLEQLIHGSIPPSWAAQERMLGQAGS